jgi:hypothetical protein
MYTTIMPSTCNANHYVAAQLMLNFRHPESNPGANARLSLDGQETPDSVLLRTFHYVISPSVIDNPAI